MYQGLVDGLGAVADLQYEIQEARRSMLYALTTTDSNRQVEYADRSRGADARVTAITSRLAPTSDTGEGRRLLRRARSRVGRLSGVPQRGHRLDPRRRGEGGGRPRPVGGRSRVRAGPAGAQRGGATPAAARRGQAGRDRHALDAVADPRRGRPVRHAAAGAGRAAHDAALEGAPGRATLRDAAARRHLVDQRGHVRDPAGRPGRIVERRGRARHRRPARGGARPAARRRRCPPSARLSPRPRRRARRRRHDVRPTTSRST